MSLTYLTFDQDWAPDWTVRAVLERLDSASLAGTFFATHQSPVLEELRKSERIELGGHPNFLPGSSHGENIESVVQFVKKLVPEAIGVRAHCLIEGTPQLMAYGKAGIQYDASDLRHGAEGLEPWLSWTGVYRIPIFFEDDVQLQLGLPAELSALNWTGDGLKVFNFHPILIALNAADLSQYVSLKEKLSSEGRRLPDATETDVHMFRQNVRPGIGDLFEALTAVLQRQSTRCGGMLRTLLPPVG